MTPKISIVIICKNFSSFLLNHTLPSIKNQSYNNWELLLLPDNEENVKLIEKARVIPTWPKTGPADKKDIGIQNSKGEIIAFIDDDAYPSKDWLTNAIHILESEGVTAVCGPGVTPSSDPLLNQVSGWFWSSWLGSGGAGTYRCYPGKVREVDDYPTFNLIAKKDDLQKIGGFDSNYWPGEDTKLCHDLVFKLKKKIIYDPKILVYHQRRSILVPHLKQLGRYGLHRGYFARTLPNTSRRLGYFWPSIFTLGVFGGLILSILSVFIQNNFLNILVYIYLFCLLVYLLIDLINSIWVFTKSKSLLVTLLLIPTTFISHLFYGVMFIRGLLKKELVSKYSREKV